MTFKSYDFVDHNITELVMCGLTVKFPEIVISTKFKQHGANQLFYHPYITCW